ncbi:MAG TPA: 2-C-methyl-D-erythritol 4-phosphate cytidylyltransferase [Candidatus Hydrogenedentes bacterium]|nr:2-C-methyl-D-erythritol 4-phosphate cytidylyltransferase [Candidatus Hydrogenedentota bacterium]
MNVQLLIPAAGAGRRMGAETPKALLALGGVPMLIRTLECFQTIGLLEEAVITAPHDRLDLFNDVLQQFFTHSAFRIVEGGAERQDSVSNGLSALEPATEIVIIHDAARPFVSADSIQASIDAARDCGAATVAIPVVDTILQGDENAYLVSTPDRRQLWACQTPQTFRVDVIRRAHTLAQKEGYTGTDDASLVRRMGEPVKLVMGTPLNFKVTTPSDYALAEMILEKGGPECVSA